MIKNKAFFIFILMIITSGAFAQVTSVTISGILKNKSDKSGLPYVNVVLKNDKDGTFVTGTVTNDEGRFFIADVKPGGYILGVSYVGFESKEQPLFIGSLSEFLDIPVIELEEQSTELESVIITARASEISSKLDKKTYSAADNISQSGGSVLQSMQSLPGVTVQDGKVQLRGNDKVTVLIDGKQTALTGFGSQTGLDNIPASAIDKIEIISNPSSKYDANGNAGIINIIMRKNKQNGFNGKVGFTSGLGSLWVRKENLPSIRPQYTFTPKINPTVSLNYRKDRINIFLQADNLYTQTLNKNEFVTRTYNDGTVLNSQFKRNRNTNYLTVSTGIDWDISNRNALTVSAMYGNESIKDRGDQPLFNENYSQRLRLWQFFEDEVLTTAMASVAFRHKFDEPGHQLSTGFNYTFHREDEKYFYDNFLTSSTGSDAFALIADEQVFDFNVDYTKPLKSGYIEAGIKFRNRNIPTDMKFYPGENSVLDIDAAGKATYKELIPAIYSNYVFENEKWEVESGLRLEHIKIQYNVEPGHNTYESDSYNYTQPFPNVRLAYKLNHNNKISLFYNRRVDRPNEVDIRIFPKYDDAEIIKVGNPALRPQFTNSVELGYKYNWGNSYFYSALYHRFANGTITRISSIVPGSTLVYAVFQNAGKSYNTGLETVWNQTVSKVYMFNVNGNIYRNQIDAFTVVNLYPQYNIFSAGEESVISGNLKLNNIFRLSNGWDAQITAAYLAPDIIPQGKIGSRFSIDAGVKKSVQNGKGEVFFNATDLFNTMVIKRQIQGTGFSYTSDDYYETQVIRLGYSYKF